MDFRLPCSEQHQLAHADIRGGNPYALPFVRIVLQSTFNVYPVPLFHIFLRELG